MTASASTPKYRAFISYSHADSGHARGLHEALEEYVVPKDMVGRITSKGEVPRRLGSCFIDHLDGRCGPLPQVISEALANSDHLIVVCSPKGRASEWVNKEIREYKTLGRSNRILAMIVDGKPNVGGEAECFPDALKYKVGVGGNLTTEPESQVLASNIRDGGVTHARRKLIAGLLDVSPDDLQSREVIRAQRHKMRAYRIAAAMTLLALGACVLAFYTFTFWQNEKIARAEASAAREQAERSQHKTFAIAFDFDNSVADLTNKMRISSGAAESLLEISAAKLEELKEQTDDVTSRHVDAVISLRHAEISKRRKSTDEFDRYTTLALTDFEKLRAHDPGNEAFMVGLGRAAMQRGYYMKEQGQTSGAVDNFNRAVEVRRSLIAHFAQHEPTTHRDPNQASQVRYRSDLSESLMELGNVRTRQGLLELALGNFGEGLELRRGLAVLDNRSNDAAVWAVTEMLVEQAEALGAGNQQKQRIGNLLHVVQVREKIASRDPENKHFRRLLGWGRVYLGEALIECGHARLALPHLEMARAVQKHVYDSDPENKRMIKDLAWANGYLGDAYLALDRSLDAIASYNDALALAQKALAKDGEVKSDARLRDVAYWQMRRAIARLARENIAGARDDIATAIAYRGNEDGAADQSNLELRSERARALYVNAMIEKKAGNRAEADRLFSDARRRFEDIVRDAPRVARWRLQMEKIDLEWHGQNVLVGSLSDVMIDQLFDQPEQPLDVLIP